MKITVPALALSLVLSFVACKDLLQTEPEPSCRGACDGTLRQPSEADTRAAMVRARDRLRSEVEAGQVTLPWAVNWEQFPEVTWRACPFYVERADCSATGAGCADGRGMCAHGKTYEGGTRVMVSTWQNPLATLEHETRNSFLVRGGRADLAY
jgi:hypothetical protein